MASRQCAIHQDAYNSRYICKPCREDPANKDWVETSGDNTGGQYRECAVETYRDTDMPAVFDGAKEAKDWTETERIVALGLLMGKSNVEIADIAGVSRERVRQIRDKFFDGKDVDVTKPDFSWMTEDSQKILALLSATKGLSDREIAERLDVDRSHVSRMRVFFEKVKRRIPYTETVE